MICCEIKIFQKHFKNLLTNHLFMCYYIITVRGTLQEKGGENMNSYKLCTLLVTDEDGEFYQTVVLNGDEFRRLIAEGAKFVEVIE